jgi:NAD(P)-dependent dehydrogenase (short-subunit alcohol dehydrogenase family)
MTNFERPDWTPVIKDGARILITGASGGLGLALVDMLLDGSDCIIGAHGSSNRHPSDDKRVLHLNQKFSTDKDCINLIDEFVSKSGSIDALVVLSGGIQFSGHWKDMAAKDWEHDIAINLNQPFYLARAAMSHMKKQGSGGRILLTGTESALHGGSPQSFAYATAKRGIECLIQGLAREGATDKILVNGLRFGFIKSGFHQRWHGKSDKDLVERANMVPLKRGGDPEEAAALMIYLMSDWAKFITGQMIPLTGGDWL